MKIRLFPLVLFAVTSLLTLKAFDMILNGATIMSGPDSAYAAAEEKAEKPAEAPAVPTSSERPAEMIKLPKGEGSSKESITQRVDDKRREVEERNKELDTREDLLKAAEQRLDAKMAAIKQDEQQQASSGEQGSEAKIKNLVIMYETMKTKSAAAIFNTLDMDVMIEVVTRMKPQVTSQIMAAMEPAAAQKLTVELARRSLAPLAEKAEARKNSNRSRAKAPGGPQELPRIDTPQPR